MLSSVQAESENINVDNNRPACVTPRVKQGEPVGHEVATGSKLTWAVEDFVVGKAIGKGKFGNVYAAQVKNSDAFPSVPEITALKVVHKSQLLQSGDQKGAQLLMQEVSILSNLTHSHIVPLYG
jgi:serine/threonine protein kinase